MTVVVGFVLDGRHMADGAVEPGLVEPGDPAAGGELEVVDAAERAVAAHALGLVQPDQAFGLSVVVAVTNGADGGDGPRRL